jgi:hypothetical protein
MASASSLICFRVEAILVYAAMPGLVSSITADDRHPTVTTLKTLGDVRVLIQHLPEELPRDTCES